MTVKIYILNPSSLHWYLSETYKDVTADEVKQIDAYADYNQGQVRVEYN